MPGIAGAKPQIHDYEPSLSRQSRKGPRRPRGEPKVERSARGGRSMCAISYEPQSRSLTINFSQAKLDIGFEITRHGVFFIERDGRGISNIQLPDDCLLQVNSREAKRLRRFGSAGIEVYAVYMERGNWKVALASNRMIKKLAHGRTALFFVAPSGTVQINEIGPVTVNFPAP